MYATIALHGMTPMPNDPGLADPRVASADSPTDRVAIAESFDSFYTREFPSMVALASTMVGRASAEDMAQEAMVKAHRNWAKISHYDNPGTWVRRVTINLATSTLRRRTTEVKARLRLGHREDRVLPPDPAGTEPLWDAVAQLPPKQRAAIALFYLEDRPVREIAEILDCTESTARSHLQKARENLADVLGSRSAS